MWCEIFDDSILGPAIFDETLLGQRHFNGILRGSVGDFRCGQARPWLDSTFPEQWVGQVRAMAQLVTGYDTSRFLLVGVRERPRVEHRNNNARCIEGRNN